LRGGYTNAYQEGWRWGKREDVGAVEVDLEQHGAGTHPARLLLRPYRGLVWRGGWQPALWRWTWSGTAQVQTRRAASYYHDSALSRDRWPLRLPTGRSRRRRRYCDRSPHLHREDRSPEPGWRETGRRIGAGVRVRAGNSGQCEYWAPSPSAIA